MVCLPKKYTIKLALGKRDSKLCYAVLKMLRRQTSNIPQSVSTISVYQKAYSSTFRLCLLDDSP